MLSYPAAIPLSNRTLARLAELICSHRAEHRSRWRRLNPGQQALLVLAHLRNGDTYTRLATGQKPYYSGKHKRHGMNVQALADPAGRLVWASPALPGAVHDLSAARIVGLIDALTANGVLTFADKGYQGAGGTVRTPFKRHWHRPRLSRGQKDVNRAHARIRALGERAIATLKTWKVLAKLRCCPRRATTIVQAVLVLHAVEADPYSGLKRAQWTS
ncbi:IS5/IS1182 family transposase [Microbispora triticiradicis]|uniref:IS5/IS1182 family transposase n=1 Tax=Microbispora triticiradicis TaxID=2200763 RepID=A0ABX9LQ59_9ACTN|nr:transposase family protein [Microbispora triticiradicis]RGA06045.1 IS5/IS1182 family transposase [Microbispora triticiradicis]